jgi:hypothetical protein
VPLWLVTAVPAVAFVPLHDQLPLALHDVALVLDQVIVDSPPETIVDGLSVMAEVGAAAATAARSKKQTNGRQKHAQRGKRKLRIFFPSM